MFTIASLVTAALSLDATVAAVVDTEQLLLRRLLTDDGPPRHSPESVTRRRGRHGSRSSYWHPDGPSRGGEGP